MATIMNLEWLILFGVTFTGFWAIASTLFYITAQNDLRIRLKRMMDGNRSRTTQQKDQGSTPFSVRIKQLQDLISHAFSKATKNKAEDFRILFEKAGWDHGRASYLYPSMKGISITAFYILAYLLAQKPISHPMAPIIRLSIYAVGFYLGFRCVDVIMDIIIKNRYARIQKGLSSALDLMVVATRAGLGLDKTFEMVAKETSLSNPDLCQELTVTYIELSLLPDRRLAFENLSKRLDFPLIRSMVMTLVQSEQQGTSVSQTLRGLADDFRQQKMFEAEGRAAKLPALLTVPIIVFIFPILMLIILGPSIIEISNTFNQMG